MPMAPHETGKKLLVQVHSESTHVLIEVLGEIDITTVSQLRDRLFGLADDGHPLVVDLDRASVVGAAGLGMLVGAAHRAAAHGASLYVVCTQPETLQLAQQTGLDNQIALVSSVGQALHFMTS